MEETNYPQGLTETEPVNAEEAGYDPFSPEHAPALSLITLMRIYDTQLALLREANPQVAEKLVELHAEGKIVGPLPMLDI